LADRDQAGVPGEGVPHGGKDEENEQAGQLLHGVSVENLGNREQGEPGQYQGSGADS
jgi:hypothetical protein